jgi:hypothetical protein
MRVLVQDLNYAHSAPRGVILPEDATRWEANRVYSEQLWTWRQRRWVWSAARVVPRVRWEDTSSEPESSGGDIEEEDEDREEREVTPPHHSPPPEDLPPLGDLFSWQVGISVCTRQSKWPQMETEPSTGLLPQPCLTLVSPYLKEMSVVLVVIGIAHLLGVL